jgi:hypothetical protein
MRQKLVHRCKAKKYMHIFLTLQVFCSQNLLNERSSGR